MEAAKQYVPSRYASESDQISGGATWQRVAIRDGFRREVVQVMAVAVVVPVLWIQARQNGLPERRRVAGFVDSHPEVDALGMRAVGDVDEADLAMVIHRQVGGS